MAETDIPGSVPSSEGGPLPEYPSPLKYEIQKGTDLWNIASQNKGKEIIAGNPNEIISAVGLNGRLYPTLKLTTEDKFVFEVSLSDRGLNKKPDDIRSFPFEDLVKDQKFLETVQRAIRQYVSGDLSVTNGVLYREKNTAGEGYRERVGVLPGFGGGYPDKFLYTPTDTVQSPEAFLRETEFGLKILQICVSEAYRKKSKEIPTTSLTVSPDAYNADKQRRNKDMQDLMNINTVRKGQGSNLIPLIPGRKDKPTLSQEETKGKFALQGREEIEALRQSILVEKRPETTFDQIAGQDSAVEEARKLAQQINHLEDFRTWGVEPPRGIIFYGPPGTGKTLIAKALAHETNAGFVLVKAADIASKWHGDSEKLAHGVFDIAREEAKKHGGTTILFIDEADAIVPSRGGSMHEVTNKTISTILQEIDGLSTEEQEQAARIVVVAATNRIESVDSAFLSRMTNWVEVPLPDESGRAKIFEIQFAARSQKAGRDLLPNDFDFSLIAKSADGLSGREIADVVANVLRDKALKAKGNQDADQLVSNEDIKTAIKNSSKVMEKQRKLKESKPSGPLGFNLRNQ